LFALLLNNSINDLMTEPEKQVVNKFLSNMTPEKTTEEDYKTIKQVMAKYVFNDFPADFMKKYPPFVTSEQFASLDKNNIEQMKDLLKILTTDTNIDTSSNYRYWFGQAYRFVNAHPEPTWGWHYGDEATGFYNDLETFLKDWPLTSVNSAHNFFDNQDKSTVLHNLLVHPAAYQNSDGWKGANVAMAEVLKFALCKALDITDGKALDQHKSSDPLFRDMYNAIEKLSKEQGEKFGTWPLPKINQAILKIVGNKKETKQVTEKMFEVLFNSVTDKYLRMLYLSEAVNGMPTMYAGTEMGITGGESDKINNFFVNNRSPLP
jgi:hypothetical protein